MYAEKLSAVPRRIFGTGLLTKFDRAPKTLPKLCTDAPHGFASPRRPRFMKTEPQQRRSASDNPPRVLAGRAERDDAERNLGQQRRRRRLYAWTRMAAVELVEGLIGDDGFTDFRTFIVATGRQSFEPFRDDPDTLVDIFAHRGIELAEPFGAVADQVYFARTGRRVSDDGADPLEPYEPPVGDPAILGPLWMVMTHPGRGRGWR
ncbi:DUF4240 domain-containing protein [Dactylosporangium sp. NPDC005555]|uniref:DUF4240 domain-containing protein n=1 Tax=Dactylosporangium sp. NPDC005555 TaxID=3154889 RepID=UPI0033A79AFC